MSETAPDTDRRAKIERLNHGAAGSFEPEVKALAAQTLALLEIADAVDRLAAEIKKAGGTKK